MLRSKKIKRGNFKLKKNYSKLRITLDNSADLKLIRNMARKINPKKYFSWKIFLPKLENYIYEQKKID